MKKRLLAFAITLLLLPGFSVVRAVDHNRYGPYNLTTGHSFTLGTGTQFGPLTVEPILPLAGNNFAVLESDAFGPVPPAFGFWTFQARILDNAGATVRNSSFTGLLTGINPLVSDNAFAAATLENGNIFLVQGNADGTAPVKFTIMDVSAATATSVASGNVTAGNVSTNAVFASKLSNGNIAVVWLIPGSFGVNYVCRIFDPLGNAVSSANTFLSGTATAGYQIKNISAGKSGGFLVSFSNFTNATSRYKISGTFISNAGVVQQVGGNNIFDIDATPVNSTPSSKSFGLANGNYLIVYDDGGLPVSSYKIISPSGATVKAPTVLASNSSATVINTPGNEGFVLGNYDPADCLGGWQLTRYDLTGTVTEATHTVIPCPVVFPIYFMAPGLNSGMVVLNYDYDDGFASYNASGISFEIFQVPVTITSAATAIAGTTATLHGAIDPNSATATATFEYSADPTLATGLVSISAVPSSITAGSGSTAVAANAMGLSINTTYYFRVRSSNANGAVAGTILSFTTNAVLPVQLVSFTGRKQQHNVLLKWESANEIAFSHFDVERSRNGIDFSKIGEVPASGSTNSHYEYIDSLPGTATVFYRLKMIDIDGLFSFSTIVTVRPDITARIEIYPNPASSELQVSLPALPAGITLLRVLNSQGQVIFSRSYRNAGIATVIPLNIAKLNAGGYFLQVTQDNFKELKSFVKQ